MSWVRLGVALVVGVALLGALHGVCLYFYPKPELDFLSLSDFYPFSVFRFRRPEPYQLGLAAVFITLFVVLWPRLEKPGRLGLAIAAGVVCAVLSNGLHGVRFGLDYPTATLGDDGIEYFHDAIAIPGPIWLLQHFNAVQFELLEHSRTHPPGPVILYWALYQLLRIPALISVAIAALGLALTLPALRRLLVQAFGEEPPGALLLFAILPAFLVYGLAVVDGPIAGLFTLCIATFVGGRRHSGWLAGALLFGCAFFTFAALFLLPVMLGFELWRRRRVRATAQAFGTAVALLLLCKLVFGFDWLSAFLKASAMENEEGFLLLAQPKRYLWYRLGAVAEIAAFFTPFLALLLWRGRSLLALASRDAWILAIFGPATLAAMLLAGAFKIGEAARICLFVLPYLFLPVAAAWRELGAPERARTAQAVLGFGVVMQLFGFYQW